MQKRHLFRYSLFTHIFLLLWISIIAIACSVWLLSHNYQNTPKNYGDIEFNRSCAQAIQTVRYLRAHSGTEALKTWLADKEHNHHPVIYVVNDEGYDLIDRPVPRKAVMSFFRPEIRQALHRIEIEGKPWFVFGVRDGVPKRHFLSTLWHTPVWALTVMALIATILIATLIAWSITRPIARFRKAMQHAAESEFSDRLSPAFDYHYKEIRELAQQYDAMAEKIHGLLARQKRLFHDVSHELRSPLARIELAVALAEKSPPRTPEVLLRIEREIQTLDHLVEELLTYARLDDNAPMNFEDSDLIAVIESVTDDARFEGSARNIEVRLEAPDSIPIPLHIDSMSRAIENLIRNALRYSPDNGCITICARCQAEMCFITITDEGPGMQDEDADKLFLPFRRGKTEATGSGFGLGLAIAKRAIERHQGKIRAVNQKPHGLQIQIELPLNAAPH